MNKQTKILPLVILTLFLITIVVAEIVITPIETPSGVTSNSSVNISYNITTDFMNNLTWSWNGTNYTFYDDSLVLFMNFDNRSALGENDTHVADLSRWGNNGTVVGGSNISWTPNGKYGGAFNFSGNSTGFINVSANSVFNTTNKTVSLWFKTNQLGTYQGLLGQGTMGNATLGNGFIIYKQDSDDIALWIYNGTGYRFNFAITPDVVTDQWYSVIFTQNDSSISIYLDGVHKRTSSINGFNYTTSSLSIGSINSGTSLTLNGSIDDVMIWNRSLSSSEITKLYNSQITKYNHTNWNYNSNNENTSAYSQSYYLCSANTTDTLCSSSNSIRSVNTITTNFSNLIWTIKDNFYGVNTDGKYLRGDGINNGTAINTQSSGSGGIFATFSNTTWHKERFLESGITYIREPSHLDYYYTDTSDPSGVNMSDYYALTVYNTSINEEIEFVKWAYDNNIKVLYVISSVPYYLRDLSSGLCNATASYSCPPSNYTKWNNILLDFLNRVTSNGIYNSSIEIEVWNEPDSQSFWLNNISLTNGTRFVEYNRMYNNTYNTIKSVYPNMPIGGGGVANLGDTGALMLVRSFLSNFTNEIDFLSLHEYLDYSDGDYDDRLNSIYTSAFDNITDLGANVSKIVLTEFNVRNSTIQNSSLFDDIYEKEIILSYLPALITYPNNITPVLFMWSERYKYENYLNYPEYPYKWAIVSEPIMDNYLSIPYNATKKLANLCPAGGQVYQSSRDTDELQIVSCKDGDNYGIIVINTDTESKNVTKDATGFTGTKAYLMDIYTGTLYLNNNTDNLGVMDSYDITYLGSPRFSVNENNNLTKTALTGESYSSNEMYFTANSTNLNKHLASTLAISVSGNVTFNVDSCDSVGNIYYTPNGGGRIEYQRGSYTCESNQVTINNLTINPSIDSNEIEIEYGCSSTTRAGYKLVMIFASILLILFIIFTTYNFSLKGELDLGKIILLFIGIILGISLWLASGQNLGSSCGGVG